MNSSSFQKKIWNFYSTHRRDFPWRNTTNPYHILVSEIMLQQTQTSRVVPKYKLFLENFPTFSALAETSPESLLRVWSGLGYNRRALYLKKTAELVIKDNGNFPLVPSLLEHFPGIGKNTAGAVYVFSTDKPHVFIETNIRRVFIHEFFKNKEKVLDQEILKLIDQTLDTVHPRDWYYALMDYGAHIGKTITNPNRKSLHYTKQSKFEGSVRQTRGAVIKLLLTRKRMSISQLKKEGINTKHLSQIIDQLEKEGFITRNANHIQLTS